MIREKPKSDLRRELLIKRNRTHGMYGTAEYCAWRSMLTRCLNRKNNRYRYYGGRGIRVCSRWLSSFQNFYADMGLKPSSKHTLDRIDGSGGYEPGNCRWATYRQQNRNNRHNRYVTYDGLRLCVSEWAERMGIRVGTLLWRLDNGWTVEDALSRIPQKRREELVS